MIATGLFTVAAILAYDFGAYLEHRMQHRIAWLWEFHKVHHSAEVLTPVTALRVHPVGDLFGSAVIAATLGATNGAFLYFYDGKIAALEVLGVNILLTLHYTIGAYHLQHSHI
jgi:sterol desaturase/sphingolipid hydroxylase (fatty acid hydroxylase superfamily)